MDLCIYIYFEQNLWTFCLSFTIYYEEETQYNNFILLFLKSFAHKMFAVYYEE